MTNGADAHEPRSEEGGAAWHGQGVTVVILTYNEGRHIVRALDSVRSIAEAVIVIDSFSTDDTVALAEAHGARVLRNRFINYSKQFQWGLDHGAIATPWIMRLDADEVIEHDLQAEIAARLPMLPADVAGINFSRKHIFMGRWVRHGGRFPLVLLRMWRTGQGRIEDRWMDEHMIVWGGRTIDFRGGFADVNLNDLTFFTEKHNKYATREAIDVLSARHGLNLANVAEPELGSRQARAKRWLKEKVYNRLPVWAGPLGYFLYRYIVQRGFLDGTTGLIYHLLQGFWYRFLVNAKVVELDMRIMSCATRQEKIARLAQLTGHRLTE